MDGIVALLALCVAGVLAAALGIYVLLSRAEHERSGWYGAVAQRRRREADVDAATVAAIVERSDRDELARLVDRLDHLAWHGTPLVDARPIARTGVWTLRFTDGSEFQVHARDGRILRRAAALSRREPLVVSDVRVTGDAVVVQLHTPHHAPLAVTLTV